MNEFRFSKKQYKRSKRWTWLFVALGVVITAMGISAMSGSNLELAAFITVIGLMAVVVPRARVAHYVIAKKRNVIRFGENSVRILEYEGNLWAISERSINVFSVNSVIESKDSYIIRGDINVEENGRNSNVSEYRLKRFYEHDEELFAKLKSMERK